MSGADRKVLAALERAFPPQGPLDLDAGWRDVLARAEMAQAPMRVRRRRGRRFFALALAFAAAVLICGSALAAAGAIFGAGPLRAFQHWLGAGPGRSARPAVQRRFAQANAASVARFPAGTALRLIVSRDLDGTGLELYGLRAGRSLCLRLKVDGQAFAPSCAPARQLTHGRQPAHVLLGGLRVAGRHGQEWTVSYGLATDAVRGVRIVDRAGRHRAVLAENAFVFAARGAERPLGAIAIDARGDEVPIALTSRAAPAAGAGYPRLQPLSRAVREAGRPEGTLGWLLRRRPRGLPLRGGAVRALLPAGARLIYARQLRPDPGSRLRVGVALIERGGVREVCEALYEPLAGRPVGCADAKGLFARHYVLGRVLAAPAAGQRHVLVGLVSPQVSEVSYLHAGMDRFRAAPIGDGVFAIAMPISSAAISLQVDGRLAAGSDRTRRRALEELESGTWRARGSR